jgi:hypothetical protein
MLAACLGKRTEVDDCNPVEVSARNHDLFTSAGIRGKLVRSPKTSGRFYPNYFSTRPAGVLRELFLTHMPAVYHALKVIGR